jgi:hypothetical protein
MNVRNVGVLAAVLLLSLPSVGYAGASNTDRSHKLLSLRHGSAKIDDDDDWYEAVATAYQNLADGWAAAQRAASPPPIPTEPGIGPAIPNKVDDFLSELTRALSLLLGSPPTRQSQFDGLNPPPGGQELPTRPPLQPNNNSGPNGGSHHFVNPNGDPNYAWGTGGCNGCVGLVVLMPDGSIAIFHFAPGDDVISTLAVYNFPPGSTFVIFGGDNEEISRLTLWRLRLVLQP